MEEKNNNAGLIIILVIIALIIIGIECIDVQKNSDTDTSTTEYNQDWDDEIEDTDSTNNNEESSMKYTDNTDMNIKECLKVDAYQKVESTDGSFEFAYPKYVFNDYDIDDVNNDYNFYYKDEDENIKMQMRVYTEEYEGNPVEKARELYDNFCSRATEVLYQIEPKDEIDRVGDIISWGNYPNTSNGSERPIKWKILKIKGDNALLLCDNILDAKAYHNKRKKVTWKTSDIRKWLNEDFYDTAFNFKEKICIRNTFIEVKNNLIFRRNDIEDKIFLLSKEEVEKFFLTEKDRKVQATNYALNRGVCPGEDEDGYYYRMEDNKLVRYRKKDFTSYASWWLRSIEKREFRADMVREDGTIGRRRVHWNDIGIRPALWIDLAVFNMVSQW